jgi:hypothetical protein
MKQLEIQPLNALANASDLAINLPSLPSDAQSKQEGTYEQINHLFNEQDQQEKTVQEAIDTLGKSAQELSDSEVYDMVNDVQYLVDIWLEEFERKTFDGKTLNELLDLNS